MTAFHRLSSTALGIGYIGRGAGTIAALACASVWYLLKAGDRHPVIPALVTAGITVLGIWSAGKMESAWGKDNQRVVIDEVAGMCVSLLWIPLRWPYIIAAFALFRFFDILKPLFIKKLEKLPGGWGVMLDDILAGVYVNLVLQLIIKVDPFR